MTACCFCDWASDSLPLIGKAVLLGIEFSVLLSGVVFIAFGLLMRSEAKRQAKERRS